MLHKRQQSLGALCKLLWPLCWWVGELDGHTDHGDPLQLAYAGGGVMIG